MLETLLNDIVAYKRSAAVIAAIRLNLFSCISEMQTIDLNICREKGWNLDYMFMLLEYLSELRYLKSYNKRKWSLAPEYENQVRQVSELQNLVKHESNIFGKVISPDTIIQAIQSNSEERIFDQVGFNKVEKRDYDRAVYENSSTLIGFQILRKLRTKKVCKVAEFGRTKEIYKGLFDKQSSIEVQYTNINNINDLSESYHAVIMTNAIHYYTSDELQTVLEKIKEHLNPDGFLCISDLFVDRSSNFNKSLYIDWLTHGGINHICIDSVCSVLREKGFQKTEIKYIENISTYLIFIYK